MVRLERRRVLRRSVHHADGQTVDAERVFCVRASRSLDLEACARCEAFVDLVEHAAGDAEVRCVPRELESGVDVSVTAGALAHGAPVCVREDVPVRSLARLIFERDLPFVLVVDATDRLLGIVWPKDLLRAQHPASGAVDVMTNACSAEEHSTVRRTLLHMVATRMRSVPLLDADGTPIGVVRDVDALRAWAATRG